MQLSHVYFVIVISSLLHRLAWGKSLTDDQLVQMAVDFVIKTYGPSTKDVKHLRRKIATKQTNKQKKGAKLDVT